MYVLKYGQPFEYDDDSPSGVGDHEIRWSEEQRTFKAENSEEARRFAVRFLLDDKHGVNLNPSNPNSNTTFRKFKSLNYEEDIGLGEEYEALLKLKGNFL